MCLVDQLTSQPKVSWKLPQLSEISIVNLTFWPMANWLTRQISTILPGGLFQRPSPALYTYVKWVKVNISNTPNIPYTCKLYYLVHKLLKTFYILKRSKCATITIYNVIIVLLMLGHRLWNLNLLGLMLSLTYIGLWINHWAIHAVVQCLLQLQLCIFLLFRVLDFAQCGC